VLAELRVENLGIIADLALVLGPGLTAITGETGAGKTLVVEALELLVGGRADAAMVRPGTAETRVEGRFVDAGAGEAEMVLARVVPIEGRSRAYLNGRLATASELGAMAAGLVDLHGQHAHQSLLSPVVQRAALDRFAGTVASDALASYRTARAEMRRLDEGLASLGGDARSRAREIDLLRFQVGEIDAADLSDPGEDVALEAEEALLADAAAHREALAAAYAAVSGGAVDAAGAAAAALAGRRPFESLAERLRTAQGELAELARELRLATEGVPEDPDRLETVRARRRLLRDLGRKYGETVDEMVAFAAAARERLADLEGYEERAAALEGRRVATEATSREAADALHTARTAAAGPLAEEVGGYLRGLALGSARVEVVVEPIEPSDDGADRITFLLAANAGEPARPLGKVASGGELSRAMLATRVALARAGPGLDRANTDWANIDGAVLVFDEVDAGLGGEAGIAIGRQLAALACEQQVVCVTHLAQVAAFADAQIVVEKTELGGRTLASAELVLDEARVAELSRMLAGVGESAHARRHAEELLESARGRA
jgi:DNA repair protein RecN (Recombination protein N)